MTDRSVPKQECTCGENGSGWHDASCPAKGNPTSNERLKAMLREWLDILTDGCHRTCQYDEAEGGLFNHCATCRTKITEQGYQLFVAGRGALRTALRKWLDDKPVSTPVTLEEGHFRLFSYDQLVSQCVIMARALSDDPPAPETECYRVPKRVMNCIYNALQDYGNEATYWAPRTGGVLEGCPRGEPSTPAQLAVNARSVVSLIDREVLGRSAQETNMEPEKVIQTC